MKLITPRILLASPEFDYVFSLSHYVKKVKIFHCFQVLNWELFESVALYFFMKYILGRKKIFLKKNIKRRRIFLTCIL